mgnify:FL=1
MALVQVNFMSKSLMRTVTINAILPVDKIGQVSSGKMKPFKTLYLLHGIFGNYTDWVSGTRIQAWAQTNNLAVIMPSGDNKFYVDNEKSGEMYSEFIGQELVEVTRNLFHLSDKKEDTFIGGLSMGGYGSFINGLKYHDTFGAIIGLSSGLILDRILNSTNDNPNDFPTHKRSYYESVFGNLDDLLGSDKDYFALVKKLKANSIEMPKVYMACGTEDFLIKENREFYQFLVDQGVDVTYEEGPGVHDWVFWDKYIYKALQWLPLDDQSEGIHSGNVQ